jgi:hypothetical protein
MYRWSFLLSGGFLVSNLIQETGYYDWGLRGFALPFNVKAVIVAQLMALLPPFQIIIHLFSYH